MELKFYIKFLLLICMVMASCKSGDEFYTFEDFLTVPKFDVHTHIYNTTDSSLVQQAMEDNFKLVCMNVEVPYLPAVDAQRYFVLKQRAEFPNTIYWVTAFSTQDINENGWAQQQLEYVKNCIDSGAVGVKVWKNIGMGIKNRDSNFIMIDNPVFSPVFHYMETNGILLIAHLGEPKNCWLPLDQMSVVNDSIYFSEHPEYHMYLHPEYPSYEDQINAMRRLLDKYPKLHFVGAHLASLEWDVDQIAAFLDRYPNAVVETAARIGQLQYQSVRDRDKVRNFFIKYQEQIMYGTDLEAEKSLGSETTKMQAHKTWMDDWRYFATADYMASPFVHAKVKGLQLPKDVIDKFYYRNAVRTYLEKKSPKT